MTTVERVACKDAAVVFKLYMDFVSVTPAQKKYFLSKNCLSFTLEMHLHPHRLFLSLDSCFGILQRNFLSCQYSGRRQLVQIGAVQKVVDWWIMGEASCLSAWQKKRNVGRKKDKRGSAFCKYYGPANIWHSCLAL